MKAYIRIATALALSTAAAAQAPQAAFRPGELWPDDRGVHINAHGGGILRDRGTYYWFGEHKVGGTRGNTAHVGVHVYASKNLYDWQDRGIALSVVDDPASDIVPGSIIERPKVLRNPRTGKYVMWFHLEMKDKGYSTSRSGVAVSDTVAGPYRYLGSFRPNAGVWPINATAADKQPGETNFLARDFAGGQMARDMTLFLDDDGKAYHLYSSEQNHTLHISQLSDDFLRPAGRYVRILPGDDNEAPAIFKRRGKYYLISSGLTGWSPNPARSAVADHIFGPWTPLGNPVRGTPEEVATTFGAQSTFALPAPCGGGKVILMADRWRSKDAIDGRYVWLPVEWEGARPVLRWRASWSLKDICR